jgi:hypothetical protein
LHSQPLCKLALAGLRLGLKNRQVSEKWLSDDCSYLCKGLYIKAENAIKNCLINSTPLSICGNNHQKATFHSLGDFLNPALALLGQALKKSPIGRKLDFANHPYLCKGLLNYITPQ